jgi:hypothetical protein
MLLKGGDPAAHDRLRHARRRRALREGSSLAHVDERFPRSEDVHASPLCHFSMKPLVSVFGGIKRRPQTAPHDRFTTGADIHRAALAALVTLLPLTGCGTTADASRTASATGGGTRAAWTTSSPTPRPTWSPIPITGKHVETEMTVRALCDAVIRYSDNTAGNLLLRRLGGPKGLQAALRRIGDHTIHADRYETELNDAVPGDVRDTSTPRTLGTDLSSTRSGTSSRSAGAGSWTTGCGGTRPETR